MQAGRNSPGTSRGAEFGRERGDGGKRFRPKMIAARAPRNTPYPEAYQPLYAYRTVRLNLSQATRNLLLLLALAALLGLLSRRFAASQNGTDFPEFYAAAKMVGQGAGRQLYDRAAQDRFEIRYAGRMGTYFNHPPFEALVYVPLTVWPLRGAYLVWCLLNAGFLAVVARLLAPQVFPQRDWRVLLVLFFLFVPVLLNFLQGQDSLLLLLLLSLGFAALEREKAFTAGCLLACGLFKFHLVVPLVVVLLARPIARREKRLATGFLGTGALWIAISAAVSGWGFLAAYPRFLLRLGSLPLAGIHPEEMANLRGLVSLFPSPAGALRSDSGRFARRARGRHTRRAPGKKGLGADLGVGFRQCSDRRRPARISPEPARPQRVAASAGLACPLPAEDPGESDREEDRDDEVAMGRGASHCGGRDSRSSALPAVAARRASLCLAGGSGLAAVRRQLSGAQAGLARNTPESLNRNARGPRIAIGMAGLDHKGRAQARSTVA